VREALPWVCQGDLLVSAPQLALAMEGGRLKVSGAHGPALVFTHDCALDKRRGQGSPSIERVQLLPVRDVESQDANRQKLLRDNNVRPYEALYLGSLGDWEGFVALGELYTVPAGYFEPELRPFPGHPEDPDEEPHLVFGRHGDRLGRIELDQLALLYEKVLAFWLRRAPDESSATPPGGN
jgi:hypothetical protein